MVFLRPTSKKTTSWGVRSIMYTILYLPTLHRRRPSSSPRNLIPKKGLTITSSITVKILSFTSSGSFLNSLRKFLVKAALKAKVVIHSVIFLILLLLCTVMYSPFSYSSSALRILSKPSLSINSSSVARTSSTLVNPV